MRQPIPTPPPAYDQALMAFAFEVMEQRFADIERAAGVDYTVTGGTGSRTLDVSTASAAQVADFIATFIADLKQKGMLS